MSAFAGVVSAFPEVMSAFAEVVSAFPEAMSAFPESMSAFSEAMSAFRQNRRTDLPFFKSKKKTIQITGKICSKTQTLWLTKLFGEPEIFSAGVVWEQIRVRLGITGSDQQRAGEALALECHSPARIPLIYKYKRKIEKRKTELGSS